MPYEARQIIDPTRTLFLNSQYTCVPGSIFGTDTIDLPSCRCGCVASFSSWPFPIPLPGNIVSSRSTTQSSRPEDGVRGRKKGRRIRYVVANGRSGQTRSVPSPGPVGESEVQPCQGLKTEHWLLQCVFSMFLEQSMRVYYLRAVIQILLRADARRDVKWIVFAPPAA